MVDWLTSGSVAFESPEWLKALWALPLVVIFYLFRKRARRILVPFLPFWERVFAEKKRRPSLLRAILSVLLQLLAAAAIVVALAGPYREEPRAAEQPSVVVVDRSFGTRMRSADGSLADAAAARARDVAARAGAEGPVAVAALRDGLVPASLDALPEPGGRRALDEIAALRSASAPGTRVFFVTPFLEGTPELAGVTVVASAPGELVNGGIRAVARGAGDGELVVTADPGGLARRVVARGPEGGTIAGADLPAGAAATVRLVLPAGSAGALDLRLEPEDAFPEDDRAALELPEPGKIRVVLASDAPTPALDAALVASAVMDPQGSGRVALARLGEVVGGFDVAIVAGAPPATQLPPGRYLLVGSFPSGVPLVPKGGDGEARAVRKAPVPWLGALEVEEWRVHRMPLLEAGPGLEVLVEGTRGPLVSRFDHGGARGVAVSVPAELSASTLPLLPAFPLLLRGALLELVPRAAAAGPLVWRAGSRIVLSADEAAAFAAEDGTPRPLRLAADGGGFQLPDEPGRFAAGSRRIATAWLDHPGLPGAARTADDPWPEAPRTKVRKSLLAPVLLFLLAVLIAEWCSYHFGATD